jgi:hypothetical protein
VPMVPVTVWAPGTDDVHDAPVQEPPPLIVMVVSAVTSPRSSWPTVRGTADSASEPAAALPHSLVRVQRQTLNPFQGALDG